MSFARTCSYQADIIEKKREKRSQKSKQQKLQFGGDAKGSSSATSGSEQANGSNRQLPKKQLNESLNQRSAGLARVSSNKRTYREIEEVESDDGEHNSPNIRKQRKSSQK